jgi:hypothetical protein
MKKFLPITILISNFSFFLFAQPTIQWQKNFGGTDSDEAKSIQQTSDGGFVVVGNTYSVDTDVTGNHGLCDTWIVKMNGLGVPEWKKSFGGSGSDLSNAIQPTADGGYIFTGWSNSVDGDVTGNFGFEDVWVVKLDNIGNIQWQKSFGGTGNDQSYAIQQTTDSGYILAGISSSNDIDVSSNNGCFDYWIVKLNNSGFIQWEKSYGGSGCEYVSSIQQTNDGGYIVGGWTGSNDGDVTENYGEYDYWIVKLDSSGIMQWQQSFGALHDDQAYSIQQTTDGGYIVAGVSFITADDDEGNYWILKLDSFGVLQWQKTFGGTADDGAYSIQQTADGGYIVAGGSNSTDGDVTTNSGSLDFWIVKVNSSGDLIWEKSFGGTLDETPTSIQQTTDGGFIISGWSVSNDGDLTDSYGLGDYWVVKLNNPSAALKEINNYILKLYPNPVNDILNITVSKKTIGKSYAIYDNQGRLVLSGKINAENTTIELSGLSGGLYLFSLGEKWNQPFNVVKE